MARVYGRGKGTEDRFTGIPRHAGSTDPSMLAFGALAVQPSNGAILDPAPASFGRGKLANSAGSRAGYMQELRKWSLTEARSADHISQQRRHARRRGRHVERVQRRGGGEREQRSGGGGGLSRHARVAAQRASKYDLSPLSPRHSRFLGPGGGAEAGKVAAVSMQPNHGSWSRWPSRRWVVSAQCQTVPESARPCQAVPGRARPHQRSRGPAGLRGLVVLVPSRPRALAPLCPCALVPLRPQLSPRKRTHAGGLRPITAAAADVAHIICRKFLAPHRRLLM